MGRNNGSLGRRLSWWLALQSFAALAVICLTVYAAMAVSLDAKQEEALAQREAQVLHLLAEPKQGPDLDTLKHKLDDYFVGHRYLALTLNKSDGTSLYQSAIAKSSNRTQRELRFDAPAPLDPGQIIRGTLALDTRDDAALLRRLGVTLLLAAVAGVLLISAGGVFLVRLGLQPVHRLVEQTSRIAVDTLRHPLDATGQPEELLPLIAQFNALLVRLAQSYEQLEGFNADVAHELCTPLATLMSSVELAMRKPRTDEEMRDFLGSNLEDLQRMSSIVQDMLFLSQADRGSAARREPANSLAAVISAVADYHEATLEEAGLAFEIIGDAAGEFDIPLLQRAVSNLLGNATRYAMRGTTINANIESLPNGEVQISISNEGPPLPATDLPHMFDRFYRGDPSRRDAHQHHGLGLSIVAAIARMHNGRTFARSSGGITTVGLIMEDGSLRAC